MQGTSWDYAHHSQWGKVAEEGGYLRYYRVQIRSGGRVLDLEPSGSVILADESLEVIRQDEEGVEPFCVVEYHVNGIPQPRVFLFDPSRGFLPQSPPFKVHGGDIFRLGSVGYLLQVVEIPHPSGVKVCWAINPPEGSTILIHPSGTRVSKRIGNGSVRIAYLPKQLEISAGLLLRNLRPETRVVTVNDHLATISPDPGLWPTALEV